MNAQRVVRIGLVAALTAASPLTVSAQSGWPGAASAAESTPKAETPRPVVPAPVKPVVVAEAPKPVAAAPAKPVVVEAPKPAPESVLQSLTALLARQTSAIEALLKRLDAAERTPITAPVASIAPGADPAYAAPMPPVIMPIAAVTAVEPVAPRPAAVAAPAAPAASVAPAAQVAPRPVVIRASVPTGVSRFADFQQVNLGLRYRYIDTNAGVRTNNQSQNNTSIKARFKFDRAGHYAVNAGVFSGASIVSGWNNTGMGSGDRAGDLHLKQLYFSAAPTSGLELQYGSLYVGRGEGTEITTYDNDFYLTGQRVTVKRPKQLWFDEISATQAYLGDAKLPDFWDRYHRLTESNYYQILVGKKVTKRLGISADYTEVDGVSTWRSAFGLKTPEVVVLDGVRVEAYRRPTTGPTAFGWALTADKKVGRTAMSGGFTSIDPNYGGLNGDYYNKGDRWFGKATATLFPMLSVTGSYTWALDADYAIANQERFDLVFTYDVLKTFAPAPRR